jgi:arabinogalactan oligomer / maltooligosaccharide transport system substrate-binding protein
MSQRKYSYYLIIPLVLLLAACSGLGIGEPAGETGLPPTATSAATAVIEATQPPPPTPTVVQGTVVIWHSWADEDLTILAGIIDAFQELYPNVQFDVLYIPAEELRQRYETAVRDGTGPSLLLGPVDWAPLLYDGGVVQDLSTLADPALLESLSAPAVEAGRYKGALVGLPYVQSGVVLYRNRNIIVQAPDTYEQLVDFARENTVGEEIGAYLERSFFYGGAVLNGIGGLLMDENGYPAFNNVKGVEWVEVLRNYDLAGPISFQGEQDLDLFKEGRVGMIIDGTWNMAAISETLGAENVMIDPWPLYQQGALSGYVLPEMVYLNQRGGPQDQNATWEFVRYFLSAPAQTALAATGWIPTLRDVSLKNALQAQALKALLTGFAYPVRPEMAAYPTALDTALKSVFEDGVSPAVALQTAEQSILQELDAVKAATPSASPSPAPTP